MRTPNLASFSFVSPIFVPPPPSSFQFTALDKDGSGSLSYHEVGKGLEEAGAGLSREELDLVCRDLDVVRNPLV